MKAIYFDLDGTLLEFKKKYPEIVAECLSEMNKNQPEKLAGEYCETFSDIFENQGENPYYKAAESVVNNPEHLLQILKTNEISNMKMKNDAKSDIKMISKEYEIGVLTDGLKDWQKDKLKYFGLYNLFDTFIASYETDSFKSGLEPYRVAEQRIKADEYAMVGDSVKSDVKAAKEFGWSSYHYTGERFRDIPNKIDWIDDY